VCCVGAKIKMKCVPTIHVTPFTIIYYKFTQIQICISSSNGQQQWLHLLHEDQARTKVISEHRHH
jgi:hypothetical protein